MAEGFSLAAYRDAQPAPDMARWFEVTLGVDKDDDGNETDVIVRIPPVKRWPQESIDLIATGRISEALRLAMDEDDYDTLSSFHPSFGEMEALFDKLSAWSGFRTGRPSSPRPGRG